jgi:uncharacterized membrane protein YgdD (TMEM256/DUF423 family)
MRQSGYGSVRSGDSWPLRWVRSARTACRIGSDHWASNPTGYLSAQYHMYCALALLAVGLLAATGRTGTSLQLAGSLFLIGSLVFSGSLYLMSVTGLKWLGAITPIGGVAMLAGWLALAVAAGLVPIPRSVLD